jgi:serine/threonine-protein kinase ULK/ATG1
MQKVVENYLLSESIGAGQYGKVYRAKNQKTGEVVAIKVIPLEKFNNVPKLEEFTTNEIKTLSRITNPNVVKFIEMLKTANNTYLVYEFCDGGTLEDILQAQHHMSELDSIKIFKGLINAFQSIYKENILHRDLKPSNILFHNNVVKIADFGFCKKMTGPQELTFTMVGSPIYMAPEILKGYPYNIKSDIWSLGVVLYEMLFGICPYEDKNLAGLINRIDTQPLTIPKEINKISPSIEKLLRRMLTIDYKQRIDWVELLSTPIEVEERPKLTHHHSYPQTSGITKIDIDSINHTETHQKSIRQHDAIIKTLMKERSKVVYVSNMLHAMLEHNTPGTSPVTSYILLKRILNQIEGLKKEISVENLNSKFKNLDLWEDFRMTEEYLTFSRYLNEEHEETVVFLSAFKQEIGGILHEINDDYLKGQTLTSTIDLKFLWKLLLEYVENVNETIQGKLENKEDSSAKKLMIHANEILDCINLEEFFEKILVETTMNLHEQSYFSMVKNYSKEKLQDIIQGKIASVKRKL